MKCSQGNMPDPELYPVPAVLTEKDLSLLKRNRAAKKLLPPPWRLRKFLERMKKEREARRWHLAELEGICYLVGLLPCGEHSIIVFLESLLPVQEPLMRHLLGEGLSALEAYAGEEPRAFDSGKGREYLERVAARTFRFREQMGMYHWFLSLPRREWGEPSVFDIEELLARFFVKLQTKRVNVAFSCPKKAAVRVSPDVLAALLLNLVQFAAVYEGIYTPSVAVTVRGKRMQLSFSFPDEEKIFRALALLFQRDAELAGFRGAIGMAPLFSVIVLCRQQGIGLEMREEAGRAVITLTFAAVPGVSSMFLESREKPGESWYDFWIREILFLNKKM